MNVCLSVCVSVCVIVVRPNFLYRFIVFMLPFLWAKKVIPLVQCNIISRGITFLAHPV